VSRQFFFDCWWVLFAPILANRTQLHVRKRSGMLQVTGSVINDEGDSAGDPERLKRAPSHRALFCLVLAELGGSSDFFRRN